MSGISYRLNQKSRPRDLEIAFFPLPSSLSTDHGSRITPHSTINSSLTTAPSLHSSLTTDHCPLTTDSRPLSTDHCRLPTASPYTLLEILMVVAIMALLMTITMPAFNDMMKGQGVESAARNICQRLKLARTHAISNREYVAVLFPKKPSSGTALPDNYLHRGYRACLINPDKTFKRWIPGENWSFFPTGTLVWDIDATSGYNAGAYSNSEDVTLVNCDDIDSSYSSETIPAIIFKPNGATTKSAYVVIGEGAYAGDAVVKTNADDTGVNIEINQFTGRVSYGDD